MSTAFQTRYDFPLPGEKEIALEYRIVLLMLDSVPRSKAEICLDLGLSEATEIGARVRDVRNRRGAAARPDWPYARFTFTDSRKEGPCPDGVFRWKLVVREDA